MEILIVVFLFIFGLLVGSFVNVISLRFGFVEARRDRSQCQACAKQLVWYELVPLISYTFLLGKCSNCGSRISLQYPLVELLMGAVFAWSYVAAAPILGTVHIVSLALLLFFWATFILILVYDVRHTLIPLHFVIPFLGAAVLIRFFEWISFGFNAILYDAFFGALALGGFMLVIVLITRGKGMGLGDVYIAAVLGLFFGLARGVEVLALAFWIGAVVGILLIILKKGFRMKSEVAFVPFLFIATIIGAYTTFSPFELVNSITQFIL